MGHKFMDRVGDPTKPDQRSPVFLQFLDCVHQIAVQFPTAFEFNLAFLVSLAENVMAGHFGTFLFNTERERRQLDIHNYTVSIWAYADANRAEFCNPHFSAAAASSVLLPVSSTKALVFWQDLYLRYDTAFCPESKAPSRLTNANDDRRQSLKDKLGHSEGSTVYWMPDGEFCFKEFFSVCGVFGLFL